MATFEKILVLVDFSKHSTLALDTAVALARDAASLTIVNVYEPLAFALPEGYQLFSEQQLSRLFEDLHHRLDEQRQRALAAGAARVDTQLST